MLISVIIPAYNAADTIADTLASVTAQAFRDLEVIVVDDASVDGTAEVIRRRKPEVGENDRQLNDSIARQQATPTPPYSLTPVLVTLPRNCGPAAARNRGIREAKGEWIAFLDADDVWLPDKLAIQTGRMREQPDVAMWCGGVIAEGDDKRAEVGNPEAKQARYGAGLKPEVGKERDSASGFKSQVSAFRRIRLEEFACGNPVATSTVLLRKSVLEVVGGFDEGFRGPEDYDLWMRIAQRFPVAKIETPLAHYRICSGSLSMDDRSFLPEVLRVLDKAYGPDGVFHGSRLKASAVSHQYLTAAWMAAERGAMARAWKLYWKSFLIWPRWRLHGRAPWTRLRLFLRLVTLMMPWLSAR